MTTLGQMMCEVDPEPFRGDQNAYIALRHVQYCLSDKADFKGVAPANLIRYRAEKFVFDCNPADVIAPYRRAGQLDPTVVMKTVRAPTDMCWIEWVERIGGIVQKFGILYDAVTKIPGREGDALVIMCSALMDEDLASVIMGGFIQRLPQPDPTGVKVWVHWGMGQADRSGKTDENETKIVVDTFGEWVAALFLITTPKVCEEKPVTWDRKIQKARAKKGKFPLIEYKKMNVRIGMQTRYTRDGKPRGGQGVAEGEARRRRLHKVLPHFRTYQKGRETPYVALVEEHYRGDPKEGILLHERHMKEGAK